ncbi:DedA family protein [Mycolicibacterium sp. CBM1]
MIQLPELPGGPLFYLAVALIVMLSSIPVLAAIVAVEPVVIAVALLASPHHPLSALVLVMIAGAIAGDSLSYALGRRYGPKLFSARIIRRSRRKLVGTHRRVRDQRMLNSMLTQRWVPPARGVVPTLLGANRRHFPSFLACSALASSVWALALVVGTHVGGPHLIFTVATVMLAWQAFGLIRRLIRRLSARRQTAPPTHSRPDETHAVTHEAPIDRAG